MTESEWLTTVNTQAMIAAVSGKRSERLWRLFAVACARTVEDRMRDARSRNALNVAERFADGLATREELQAARARAEAAAHLALRDECMDEVRANFCVDAAYEAVCAARWAANAAVPCVAEDFDIRLLPESLRLPDLLREVFGNPFRWKLIDPAWLSWNDGAARNLAQLIYDNCSFDLLPILADALEEAGCGDAEILNHCRGLERCPACLGEGKKNVRLITAPRHGRQPVTEEAIPCVACRGQGHRPLTAAHVRGCWALDLALGRE